MGFFGSKIHSSNPKEVKGETEERNVVHGGGALRDDFKGQYLP